MGDTNCEQLKAKALLLWTKGGNTRFIKDVLFVPSLTQNVLDFGQLIKKCKIMDKNNNKKKK